MIRPRKETEDVLFSITKNCETLIKQTHRKAQGTLKFKPIQSKETFWLKTPISVEGSWKIRLTNLEVNKSGFNITEETNKFKAYLFDGSKVSGISYEKVRDDIEKDLENSDITATNLQNEIIGPIILDKHRK